MEAALLYLLKAHAVLALFAAAYYGLLRRLTFFTLNRAFLLLAVVVAVGYPLLPAPAALAGVVPSLGLPAPALAAYPHWPRRLRWPRLLASRPRRFRGCWWGWVSMRRVAACWRCGCWGSC